MCDVLVCNRNMVELHASTYLIVCNLALVTAGNVLTYCFGHLTL